MRVVRKIGQLFDVSDSLIFRVFRILVFRLLAHVGVSRRICLNFDCLDSLLGARRRRGTCMVVRAESCLLEARMSKHRRSAHGNMVADTCRQIHRDVAQGGASVNRSRT